jgi:type 1 glutamine amidotransferase
MKTIKFLATFLIVASGFVHAADSKNIILIAGRPSHGPGDHEFNAGSLLLSKCLNALPGIHAEVHNMGWPKDENVFDKADAVLIYADGGSRHPAIQAERLALIDGLVEKGVGIGCAHYGVEVPKGDPGEALHRWIGGYYEHLYSCNPMWTPEFLTFPDHPVANGVQPFKALDEWYFNMRWTEGMKGVTPILVAKPSDDVRDGPYIYPKGPYPHIAGAKGRDETMMWVLERENGGRGFGFTGGHKHANWGDENYRKVVLNGLLWIAKAEVPEGGAPSTVTEDELKQNLDPKKR